jgi:hypothetical protein
MTLGVMQLPTQWLRGEAKTGGTEGGLLISREWLVKTGGLVVLKRGGENFTVTPYLGQKEVEDFFLYIFWIQFWMVVS